MKPKVEVPVWCESCGDPGRVFEGQEMYHPGCSKRGHGRNKRLPRYLPQRPKGEPEAKPE